MQIQNAVSIKDFLDHELLNAIFTSAADLQSLPNDKLPPLLQNKIIACLFYEPSTRTRFSFETAVHRLGGDTISTENASEFSSTTKGESLEDTIRTLNEYVDGIVIRHPQIGAAEIAAGVSRVPIFNAGDGGGEHPTQALLDLYTIVQAKGSVDGLKVGLVGDLLYGRTIHSLIYLLSLYDVEISLIAPAQLRLPESYLSYLREHNIKFHILNNWDKVINNLDVIYMTRVQKERLAKASNYSKLKDVFRLDGSTLPKMKHDAVIMHPLPRVSEIAPEVDDDPRAIYFKQARNGLYVRMALLKMACSKK